MNLLEFLEDERPVEIKGSLIRIREPTLLVHIPPRKVVVISVKKIEKSSGENKESEHP